MNARWVIGKLGSDANIERLVSAVEGCGREAEVLTLRACAELLEAPSNERACVVTTGSIWLNATAQRMRPNWIGNWHGREAFACRRY